MFGLFLPSSCSNWFLVVVPSGFPGARDVEMFLVLVGLHTIKDGILQFVGIVPLRTGTAVPSSFCNCVLPSRCVFAFSVITCCRIYWYTVDFCEVICSESIINIINIDSAAFVQQYRSKSGTRVQHPYKRTAARLLSILVVIWGTTQIFFSSFSCSFYEEYTRDIVTHSHVKS